MNAPAQPRFINDTLQDTFAGQVIDGKIDNAVDEQECNEEGNPYLHDQYGAFAHNTPLLQHDTLFTGWAIEPFEIRIDVLRCNPFRLLTAADTDTTHTQNHTPFAERTHTHSN